MINTNSLLPFLVLCLVAIVVVGFLVWTDSLEFKWQLFTLMGFFLFLVLLPVKRKKDFLFVVFIFFLPVMLNVNVIFLTTWITTSGGLSVGVADIALAALYLLWIKDLASKKLVIDKRFLKYLALYASTIGLGVLSMINAEILLLSIFELKTMVFCFLSILYISCHLKSQRQIYLTVCILSVSVIFQSGVGCIQYITGSSLGLEILGEGESLVSELVTRGGNVQRVTGLLLHPNLYASFLAFLLPIMLSVSFAKVDRTLKILTFLASCSGMAALTMTLSRAGLGSFGIAALVLIIILNKNLFRRHSRFIVGIYLLMAFIVLAFSWDNILHRIYYSTAGAFRMRKLLAQSAYSMIADHPILGIGLNNYTAQLDTYDTLGVVSLFRYPVHNAYLLIASEMGIISLSLLLIFIFLVQKSSIVTYFNNKGTLEGNFCLGAFCGIIAVLAHSFLDFPLRVSNIHVTFFTVCTILLAIQFNIRKHVYALKPQGETRC